MREEGAVTETFVCAECNGTFNKGRSDEEALAEASANGFDGIPQNEMVVVCDDCHNAIIERNKHDPRSHFYEGHAANNFCAQRRTEFIERVSGDIHALPGGMGYIKAALAGAIYDIVPTGVQTTITVLPRTHWGVDEILIRLEAPGGWSAGGLIYPSLWYRIRRAIKECWQ